MTISIDSGLEARLRAEAERLGVHPHGLALTVLRERFPKPVPSQEEHEEWVRGLRALATDCGVSLSNEALSSDGLYD